MSKAKKTDLTTLAEASARTRTGNRPIVLHVSPHLFGQIEARAAADRFDLHEWVLRAVISELLRLQAELVSERQTRAVLAAMPPLRTPATERKDHAPHP